MYLQRADKSAGPVRRRHSVLKKETVSLTPRSHTSVAPASQGVEASGTSPGRLRYTVGYLCEFDDHEHYARDCHLGRSKRQVKAVRAVEPPERRGSTEASRRQGKGQHVAREQPCREGGDDEKAEGDNRTSCHDAK